MKKIFLPVITKAMNAYLQLDSNSVNRLKKLKGKAVTLELLPMHFTFHCIFDNDSMQIETEALKITQATIRGTPLQIVNVILTKDNRHQFFADDIKIEGDAEIAQQVISLFDELNIDWENELSQIIGDVPAYHIGRVIHQIGNWISNTAQSFNHDINEYIHEEANWFPPSEALQNFFADIDTLRMDIDRAEARILALKLMAQKDTTPHINPKGINEESK